MSDLAVILQATLGFAAILVVIFGPVAGLARLYKKHIAGGEPNTGSDFALTMTFIGAVGMLTAGVLPGEVVGEFFLGSSIFVLVLCGFATLGKLIYRMV